MRFRLALIAILILASVGIWHEVFVTRALGELNVYVLNVGQGDAVYVRAPSGKDMLIDTGPNDKVIGELEAVMPSFDRTLDVLLLTHTDADHTGGAEEVVTRYDIGQIIENGASASSSVYEAYRERAVARGIPRAVVDTGDVVRIDADVALDILLPRAQDVHAKNSGAKIGTNDIAIVGRLRYKHASMLLTADIERRGEVALATSNAELKSDVLKVAHHGSKYSSWKLFLDTVRPQLSAISVGRSNRYGHPTEQALERLADEGGAVLRTDRDGRIHLRSTGTTFAIVKDE